MIIYIGKDGKGDLLDAVHEDYLAELVGRDDWAAGDTFTLDGTEYIILPCIPPCDTYRKVGLAKGNGLEIVDDGTLDTVVYNPVTGQTERYDTDYRYSCGSDAEFLKEIADDFSNTDEA